MHKLSLIFLAFSSSVAWSMEFAPEKYQALVQAYEKSGYKDFSDALSHDEPCRASFIDFMHELAPSLSREWVVDRLGKRAVLENGKQLIAQDQYAQINLNIALAKTMFRDEVRHESLELLLTLGAYKQPVVNCGTSLVRIAAARGSQALLDLFARHNFDVNYVDYTQESPLMAAALQGRLGCVQTLLDHGADVNFVNKDGASALSRAFISGNDEVIEALLVAGAKN